MSEYEELSFKDDKGEEITYYKWTEGVSQPVKGIVQIVHGMAEHALRYKHFAIALIKAGYIVYADDHIAHGKTAGGVKGLGIFARGDWERCVDNIQHLTHICKTENPDVPIFLVGHSWGSIMGQQIIQESGSDYAGAILTGTYGKKANAKSAHWKSTMHFFLCAAPFSKS